MDSGSQSETQENSRSSSSISSSSIIIGIPILNNQFDHHQHYLQPHPHQHYHNHYTIMIITITTIFTPTNAMDDICNVIGGPSITKFCIQVWAYYNGPKFKCPPESGTGGFSFNIFTKNLKHPWPISLKTLGHFKITILNTMGNHFFIYFFKYWAKLFNQKLEQKY